MRGATSSDRFIARAVEHDPEKWEPVFSDKRFPFVQRSCSNKEIDQDDDSTKRHPDLVANIPPQVAAEQLRISKVVHQVLIKGDVWE
ncbi:hypothetical protein [Mesorhizobium sp. LjRoot246]|uniref:hypothetical protein n=1 Tax=Mesorhizobium sp. LjRoot246 TaxID=3342294 RepID=UPI003ECEECBD